MGKDINQLFHGIPPCDEDDDELCESSSSSGDDDDDGEEDCLLPGFREEDAISSSNSPSLAETTSLPPHVAANGPLHDLSSLTAQLPIKRGLSKYYDGKSQSFTSLSDVRCLEDLPKKLTPYGRKMKSCKSYGGVRDGSQKLSNRPPGTSSKTSSKKASGGSCASSMARSGSKPPPSIRVQKNFCLH